MRRIVYPLMALSLAAAPAVLGAQTPHDRDARQGPAFARGFQVDPAARVLELGEQLGLTSEQVARIEAIQARYRAATEPLIEQFREAMPGHARFRGERGERARELTPEQREVMRQRMAERRAEHAEHMRELTPEQREEMRQRMAERRAEHAEHMRELTPEQREEMRQRMSERRGERGAAMRERAAELRPVMEQLRANREQAVSEIHEVLTSEQRSQLDSIQQERRRELRERREHRGQGEWRGRTGPRGERGQGGEHRGNHD